MKTRKLATAFMIGALSVLLSTFGSFQSAYAGGRHVGSGYQARFNQPMKLVGPKQPSNDKTHPASAKLLRPDSQKYPGLK